MEKLIKRDKYKDFEYLIAENSFGNYNGYFINLNNRQFEQLSNIEYLIHGGITLTATFVEFNHGYVGFVSNEHKDTVIGFDTMHGDDISDDMISSWTAVDVENHIKEVIDHIE